MHSVFMESECTEPMRVFVTYLCCDKDDFLTFFFLVGWRYFCTCKVQPDARYNYCIYLTITQATHVSIDKIYHL